MNNFYTYISYNSQNTIHSIGVTNNLKRRFRLLNSINKCNCKLVYYEEYDNHIKAIKREDELNSLTTNSILLLVKENNPSLLNLLKDII